ncbi:hypothetical protein AC3_A0621 [Clostridium perfringens E str. JGS1987]|uniref:Uncharacterized protein n=1 Tax=Clostridium perfringens E str. JGS1987 TaxID=451755 RepID=B1BYF6_CLOPF|nr:hypothetical protein AC3_A0621 [Clostridium perfringens E str. JGS1987]
MKRFLWFNLEKLKTDKEYFLVVFMFLIIIQLAFYFPLNKSLDFSNIFLGFIFTLFFIYVTFCKKTFSYKEVWQCFWKC